MVLPLAISREEDRPDVELLTAAARVIQRERLGSDVEVEGQEASPTSGQRLLRLRLDLFFPEDLLSGLYPWSAKGPAAALLFSRLRPLLPGGSDGRSHAERLEAESAGWEPRPGSGDPYTVTSCLLRQVDSLLRAAGGQIWFAGAVLPWGSRNTQPSLPC